MDESKNKSSDNDALTDPPKQPDATMEEGADNHSDQSLADVYNVINNNTLCNLSPLHDEDMNKNLNSFKTKDKTKTPTPTKQPTTMPPSTPSKRTKSSISKRLNEDSPNKFPAANEENTEQPPTTTENQASPTVSDESQYFRRASPSPQQQEKTSNKVTKKRRRKETTTEMQHKETTGSPATRTRSSEKTKQSEKKIKETDKKKLKMVEKPKKTIQKTKNVATRKGKKPTEEDEDQEANDEEPVTKRNKAEAMRKRKKQPEEENEEENDNAEENTEEEEPATKRKKLTRKGKKKVEKDDEEEEENEEEPVTKKKKLGNIKGKKKVQENDEDYEDEDTQDKKKRKKKKKDGPEFKSLRSKTTVKPFYRATTSLTTERKLKIREMGFGSLLDFPLSQIASKIPYFVLKNLDTKKMEVNFPNGSVLKITPKKIREVLGIPMGKKKLESDSPREYDDEFLLAFKAQFPGKKYVTVTDLSNKIQATTNTDFLFQMNYLMLFSNCMIHCDNSARLVYYVLKHIKSTDVISDFDWCTFVWDSIQTSKENWNDTIVENWYYGPNAVLMLLYLHYTKIDGMVPMQRKWPAIRNWTDQSCNDRENFEMTKLGKEAKIGLVEVIQEDDIEDENQEDAEKRKLRELIYDSIEEKFESVLKEKNELEELIKQNMELNELFVGDEKLQLFAQRFKKEFSKEIRKDVGTSGAATNVVTVEQKESEENAAREAAERKAAEEKAANEDAERKALQEKEAKKAAEKKAAEEKAAKEAAEKKAKEEKAAKEATERNAAKRKAAKEAAEKKAAEEKSAKEAAEKKAASKEAQRKKTAEEAFEKKKAGEEKKRSEEEDATNDKEEESQTNEETEDKTGEQVSDDVHASPINQENMFGKGEESAEKHASEEPKNRPKRQQKKSYYMKSPFMNKMVKTQEKLENDEIVCARSIFCMQGDISEEVFNDGTGRVASRKQIQSLAPGVIIEKQIIDTFVTLLNYEERILSANKNTRRQFFPTDAVKATLMNEERDDEKVYQSFEKLITDQMNSAESKKKMRDVNCAFFPTVVEDRYYVIVFNLMKANAIILDNAKDCDFNQYKDVFDSLKALFVKYLQKHQHPCVDKLAKAKPAKVLKLKWKTDNNIDSGLYTMMHMEMYQGEPAAKWKTDIVDKSNRDYALQMANMRMRYTTKILMHEMNTKRHQMSDYANKFQEDNKEEKKTKKMVEDAIKKRIEEM